MSDRRHFPTGLIYPAAPVVEPVADAIRCISVRGPDGDGLVWVVCTMPNGNAGAISVNGATIAAKVFTAWREAAQKAINGASTLADAAIRASQEAVAGSDAPPAAPVEPPAHDAVEALRELVRAYRAYRTSQEGPRHYSLMPYNALLAALETADKVLAQAPGAKGAG